MIHPYLLHGSWTVDFYLGKERHTLDNELKFDNEDNFTFIHAWFKCKNKKRKLKMD